MNFLIIPISIGGYTIDLDKTSLKFFRFYPVGYDPVTGGQNALALDNPIAFVINRIVLYVFPLAGLVLFFLIIASGFQLMTSTGNPETMKKAQHRMTMAIVGFIVIFASYWLIQILDAILGLHYFNP